MEHLPVLPPSIRHQEIDAMIHLWLESKEKQSSSKRTGDIYQHYIMTFRERLQYGGYDLDGLPCQREATEHDTQQVLMLLALAGQLWASEHEEDHTIISASTYNQRLSVLSSFYRFVRKRQLLTIDNPIDLLDRRKVQEYAKAQPLSKGEVTSILKKIDRSTLAGKRDYALLLVLFSTGRRASELLSLQYKHLHLEGISIKLHFEHCKGNIDMYDMLEPRVSRAIMHYLTTLFGEERSAIHPEQPIWLSLSHKNYKQALTQRGLAEIMKRHLGTSKVHVTRHTFAHTMEQSGASITIIQARLGHSNVATTGRYLQRLSSAVNTHVTTLLNYLEVEEE